MKLYSHFLLLLLLNFRNAFRFSQVFALLHFLSIIRVYLSLSLRILYCENQIGWTIRWLHNLFCWNCRIDFLIVFCPLLHKPGNGIFQVSSNDLITCSPLSLALWMHANWCCLIYEIGFWTMNSVLFWTLLRTSGILRDLLLFFWNRFLTTFNSCCDAFSVCIWINSFVFILTLNLVRAHTPRTTLQWRKKRELLNGFYRTIQMVLILY